MSGNRKGWGGKDGIRGRNKEWLPLSSCYNQKSAVFSSPRFRRLETLSGTAWHPGPWTLAGLALTSPSSPLSPPSRLGASLRGVSCPTSLSQWSSHPVTEAAARASAAAAARTRAATAPGFQNESCGHGTCAEQSSRTGGGVRANHSLSRKEGAPPSPLGITAPQNLNTAGNTVGVDMCKTS